MQTVLGHFRNIVTVQRNTLQQKRFKLRLFYCENRQRQDNADQKPGYANVAY